MPGGAFDFQLIDKKPGLLTVEVAGKDTSDFEHEGGGHRWQRIPPTERRGRVHTSTVTVAVLHPPVNPESILDIRDVEITTARGDGPGGQHRNKTESAVIAVHRPSGERVRIESDRSQHRNREVALSVLAARLASKAQIDAATGRNGQRRTQIGSGERGDKIRTYRTQDDQVTDHRTGQRWRLSRWVLGEW